MEREKAGEKIQTKGRWPPSANLKNMSFSLGWVLCLSLRVDTALTLDISLEWCGSFMSSIFFLSFYIVLFSS